MKTREFVPATQNQPNKYILDLSLLLVAFVWGSTFSLVKMALNEMPVFWFLFLRFLLAFLVFIPLLTQKFRQLDKETLYWGIGLGILLFLGYAFQTAGLKYTTSINSGFITGLFVVFTPLICALIFRWFPHWASLVGVIVAFIGLSLLTLNSSLAFNYGDLLTLVAAFSYAVYIVLVGRFASRYDPALLTWIQTFVVALASLFFTILLESFQKLPVETISITALLVTSIFATVMAFWIQIYAQRFMHPTRVALILLGEPVFAGVFGYFWLGEILTLRKFIGAVLILMGMAFSEIFSNNREKSDLFKEETDKFGTEETKELAKETL